MTLNITLLLLVRKMEHLLQPTGTLCDQSGTAAASDWGWIMDDCVTGGKISWPQ